MFGFLQYAWANVRMGNVSACTADATLVSNLHMLHIRHLSKQGILIIAIIQSSMLWEP